MQKIDRAKFYAAYRQKFGPLKQSQVDGLELLLNSMEADTHVADIRWAAYMLATTKHETADTFKPIHEYGSRQYFITRYGSQTKVGKVLGNDTPEEGAEYAGRGFPQVTGENNYEMAETALRKEYPEVIARHEARTGRKFDLTIGDQPNDQADPDNMLDPEIAYCTMSYAMRKGAFTGVGLPRYLNATRCDYLNARKIINGLDCSEKIAREALGFEEALRAAGTVAA
jgi:putative chitinase